MAVALGLLMGGQHGGRIALSSAQTVRLLTTIFLLAGLALAAVIALERLLLAWLRPSVALSPSRKRIAMVYVGLGLLELAGCLWGRFVEPFRIHTRTTTIALPGVRTPVRMVVFSDQAEVAARPAPSPPAKECLQCAIEDRRSEAHKQQVELTARYLGLEGRWLDGEPSKLDCTRDREVWGVVRFALVGDNPWLEWWGGRRHRENMALALPCPDLSRPDYGRLYRYDPDDTERDGLGHAPVLQRGKVYRLKLVASPEGIADDPIRPGAAMRALTLVAVNPL